MYRKVTKSAALPRLSEHSSALFLLWICLVGCQRSAEDPRPDKLNVSNSPQVPMLRVALSAAAGQGVYACALFANEVDFQQRKNPFRSAQLGAAAEPVVWAIDTLPPGNYAIAIFHDENQNGKLDRNAFGYPTEAYGFSNNARGKFGPPEYSAVRFELGDCPMQLEVRLE